jgi:hypothetical protein
MKHVWYCYCYLCIKYKEHDKNDINLKLREKFKHVKKIRNLIIVHDISTSDNFSLEYYNSIPIFDENPKTYDFGELEKYIDILLENENKEEEESEEEC